MNLLMNAVPVLFKHKDGTKSSYVVLTRNILHKTKVSRTNHPALLEKQNGLHSPVKPSI